MLDAPALPDAAVVARLAAARLHLAVRPGTEVPAPLYLRPADAAPPRRGNPSRGPAIGGDRPDKYLLAQTVGGFFVLGCVVCLQLKTKAII